MKSCLPVLLSLLLCSTAFAQREGPGVPDDREREEPCGVECSEQARESAAACRESDDPEGCLAALREEIAACREAAGCDVPDDREREEPCGAECHESARAAANECLRGGGSREECAESYRTELGPCLEAAGCEAPDEPDRDGGDREPPCGLPCFETARAAMTACLEGNGDRQECGVAYREALVDCLDSASCDEQEALLATPSFLRGDSNGDRSLDVADAVTVFGYLFRGQETPGCMDAADANDDGSVDLSDPVSILNRLFRGGDALPEPSAEPGNDPTPDGLDCFDY